MHRDIAVATAAALVCRLKQSGVRGCTWRCSLVCSTWHLAQLLDSQRWPRAAVVASSLLCWQVLAGRLICMHCLHSIADAAAAGCWHICFLRIGPLQWLLPPKLAGRLLLRWLLLRWLRLCWPAAGGRAARFFLQAWSTHAGGRGEAAQLHDKPVAVALCWRRCAPVAGFCCRLKRLRAGCWLLLLLAGNARRCRRCLPGQSHPTSATNISHRFTSRLLYVLLLGQRAP